MLFDLDEYRFEIDGWDDMGGQERAEALARHSFEQCGERTSDEEIAQRALSYEHQLRERSGA